jgi:SEFIR domain
MPPSTKDRVFISYSHDSLKHTQRVRALADQLRADGIEAWIDQYVQDPNEGWSRWMHSQVKQANRVLLVFTETYQRRFEGDEEEGKGLGPMFEGAIVTQALYESGGRNAKFRPVVFREEDEQFIPLELRRFNRYRVDTPDHYQNLLRWLYNAPRIVAPTVGSKPDLPAKLNYPHAPGYQEKIPPSAPGSPRGIPPPAPITTDIDHVSFSVFAPGVIRPAQQFILDLWAHLPTQTDEVTSLAREFARDRRLGIKAQVAVARDTVLSVVLDLPLLRIKDPSDTIVWVGMPVYASFIVDVPANVVAGNHAGRVIISASGIPIAKVTFSLPIEPRHARRRSSSKASNHQISTALGLRFIFKPRSRRSPGAGTRHDEGLSGPRRLC